MQLIPNAAHSFRLWSVQAFTAIAALNGAWVASPAVQGLLPSEWVAWANFAFAIVGGLLRVVAQTPIPASGRE